MTRNLSRLIGTVLVVPVACALVGVGVAGASAPQKDIVVGSIKASFADFPSPGVTTSEHYTVSASSDPDGDNPRGQLIFKSPLLGSPVAIADVTCVVVDGTHALVGGTFRQSETYSAFPGLTFRWFLLVVDDNGPEADTTNSVIFVERFRPPDFSPCAIDVPADFPVDSGNINVFNAT